MEIEIKDFLSRGKCPQCGDLMTFDFSKKEFRCSSCGYIATLSSYVTKGSMATSGSGEPAAFTIEGSFTQETFRMIIPEHTHEEISKLERELAEIKRSIIIGNQTEIRLQEEICTWLNEKIGLERKYAGQYVAITYDGEILASALDELGLLEQLHKPNYANKKFFICSVPPAPKGQI